MSGIKTIGFSLPDWYLALMSHKHEKIYDFEQEEGKYLHLWPIAEVSEINQGYNADENFPGFFLVGTYEIGEACAIEKETGNIYTVPFIGAIPDDAIYVGKTLEELTAYLQEPW
ncbi:hypothetical protein [Hymenobacter sp. HDW8]|uniref:hypothetical protein n=1 Tax=Hymenobacter sp. HDW8 TaxID=2714932 RepID=UPI00140D19EE|nr:hypothetical protein [Hymenobacter sp. HDW8]QIL74620.1 hypothetical protein G7064_01130 [Hymenobacter sp. HDW8]